MKQSQQNTTQTYLGRLWHNAPLSQFTTWRVGGLAKQIYKPKDSDDLTVFLKSLPPNEPVIWLGLGSNVLVRDGGFDGTVIITQGCLMDKTILADNRIRVEAGVSCAQMARFCAREGLIGGEFWAGIPGTMGGALRMNAGCYGSETWDFVESVEVMTRSGEKKIRTADEYDVSYRHVSIPEEEWFLSAIFTLKRGEKEKSLQQIKQLLASRNASQPTSEYNCGSVFRNPPNDYAARLIESCGLKGYCIGGAKVSEKHANFIINGGEACAHDIESLIEFISNTVKEKCNTALQPEVHIIGIDDNK